MTLPVTTYPLELHQGFYGPTLLPSSVRIEIVASVRQVEGELVTDPGGMSIQAKLTLTKLDSKTITAAFTTSVPGCADTILPHAQQKRRT